MANNSDDRALAALLRDVLKPKFQTAAVFPVIMREMYRLLRATDNKGKTDGNAQRS